MIMNATRKYPLACLMALLVACGLASAHGPDALVPAAAAQTAVAGADELKIDVRPFPREFTIDGTTFQIHQPQLDSWQGDQLRAHAAMSVMLSSGFPGLSIQSSLVLGRKARSTAARSVVLTRST